ncbi:MAG: hypothetical protein K2Q06_13925 [Parvularculaceae bacterium]|nr:hypothetical protein [Parvularculaceae bacterium]
MALDLSKAMVRRGKISEMTRDHDYEFWRNQSAEIKMAAIWEMVVFHHLVKKRDTAELRLNRSVGGFRKTKR